ncbi:MAG: hypothetical protein GTO18_16720 [Anaerolineales bacterium]|nr:hypothetical protein [Anaerolineales bacterium]
MGSVNIRLFGLSGMASRMNKFSQPIQGATSVELLWAEIQNSAEPGELIATIDRDALLVLVNGRPIHLLDGWQTRAQDGDEITFMLKTAGG